MSTEEKRLKSVLRSEKIEHQEVSFYNVDKLIHDYISEKVAIPYVSSAHSSTDAKSDPITTSVYLKQPERASEQIERGKKDKTNTHYHLPAITLKRNSVNILKFRYPHWLNDKSISFRSKIFSAKSFDRQGDKFIKFSRRPVSVEINYEIEILTSYVEHSNFL